MKQHTTKAILLRRINYGEADRILSVITPKNGKVSVLAKGVRKSKSKLAGGLELFCVTSLTYIDGKSDLKTLIGTQLDEYYSHIVTDIDATMIAYDFMKLIDTFTEDNHEESFFTHLQEGLVALNEQETPLNHTRLWFLMHLLMLSGHGVNIDSDLSGNPFNEDKLYQFSYDDMCFFEHNAGVFTPRHIKLLLLLSKVGKPSHLLKVQESDHLIADLLPVLNRCARI